MVRPVSRILSGTAALLLAVAASAVLPGQATAATPALVAGHSYILHNNLDPTYCLNGDVSSGSLYWGDRVQLYRCPEVGPLSPAPPWEDVWYWDGAYFHNEWSWYNTTSEYCLAVNEGGGAQSADGHAAVVYDDAGSLSCVAQTNLRFSVNSDGSIQNHWNGKCLDANNLTAFHNGTSIAYWGCVPNKRNQEWTFQELS